MDCKNIQEVRENINQLDTQIVKLICEREGYVKQASKFKTSKTDVKAPDRVEKVIEKVRALAAEEGGNPEIIENIYRKMISEFINMEMSEYEERN